MKYSMIRNSLSLLGLLLYLSSFAQSQENISVSKLHSDKNSSTFKIVIQDSVKMHYHDFHTENIFVSQGEAEMMMGGELMRIKKGDFFTIPEKTKHSVKVLSDEPLIVISVQSPEFKGNDRIYTDQ